MEQRSARTTQHDPRERDRHLGPEPEQERRPDGGQGSRRPLRRPRLPRPAGPDAPDVPDASDVPDATEAHGARNGSRNGSRSRPHPQPHARLRSSPRQAPARRGGPFGGLVPAPVAAALAKLPAPRLTGLGTGVFATLLMALWGWFDGLLLDSSAAVYGVFFVLVCAASGLWVRPAELYAAPIAAPLAFTFGLFCVGGPGDGITGQLQNVFTNLALHAGWLYGGTLIAGVLVLVRRAVLTARRVRGR